MRNFSYLLLLCLFACVFIAACSDEGQKFVGQWEGRMPSANPFQPAPTVVFEITHNSGKEFYITASTNGKKLEGGRKSIAILEDGYLKLDTGGRASIDAQSGNLNMSGLELKKIR